MAEPAAIAAAIAPWLGPRSLAGEVVLVTAGGTREPLDAVRFLGNRSSGKMGFAVAAEAARRGAEVVLVAGPSAQPTPAGVRRVDVETALAMRDAVLAELPRATIVIKAAAVADFRPAAPVAGQAAQGGSARGRRARARARAQSRTSSRRSAATRGAAWSWASPPRADDPVESARRKLARKGCDLIVANDVSQPGRGLRRRPQHGRLRVAGRRGRTPAVAPEGERGRASARPRREAARGARMRLARAAAARCSCSRSRRARRRRPGTSTS